MLLVHQNPLLHALSPPLPQVALEKMEQKLRTLHTNIFQMAEFIRSKESETNYKSMALNIQQLADEVNNAVKRAIA